MKRRLCCFGQIQAAGRQWEQLMAWQIPFRVRDAIPCLYDHWIAGNVLAYLRLGAGGDGSGAIFLQICNRPNRYLNREAFYDSQVSFEELYQYYEDRGMDVGRNRASGGRI